jgi:hypothetical protein
LSNLERVTTGLLCVLKEGCIWRALDARVIARQTAYGHFRRWDKAWLWEQAMSRTKARLKTKLHAAASIAVNQRASVLTPFEPSGILVYGPGKYRFADFIKVGGDLTFVMLLVVLAMVPMFWPLK